MTKLEFNRMAKNNPFRRVIVEAGDSLVAISQPVSLPFGTFISRQDVCWNWLKYLGHEGD
jgi:hypothetical protein